MDKSSMQRELIPGWYWARPYSEYNEPQLIRILEGGIYQCNGYYQNVSLLANVELARVLTPDEISQLQDRIDALRKALNRRAEVEQYLWDCVHGKKPLPDKEQCRQMALKLGIPDEYNETSPQILTCIRCKRPARKFSNYCQDCWDQLQGQ